MNPIREWNKRNSMTAPSYETVEKFADQYDQLQNPWVSVETLPDVIGNYLVYNEHDSQMAWAFFTSDKRWAMGNGFLSPTHWAPLPAPPSKGGE